MSTKTLLRPAQVAQLLGVARQTVHDYEAAGRLKAERTLGGHRRYPLEENPDLQAAMAAQDVSYVVVESA